MFAFTTLSDIKTLEEIIHSDDYNFLITTPDFDIDDAKDAVKTGFIVVFSSRPIKKGTFVTPSPMIARSYSGDGRIYSKKTNIYNIAWIDLSEGMFAPIAMKNRLNENSQNQIVVNKILDKISEKGVNYPPTP